MFSVSFIQAVVEYLLEEIKNINYWVCLILTLGFGGNGSNLLANLTQVRNIDHCIRNFRVVSTVKFLLLQNFRSTTKQSLHLSFSIERILCATEYKKVT